MKMIFISNNWADAHQQTRLKALMGSGFQVSCLAVSRKYYPLRSDIPAISLGTMEHASYPKRIVLYFRLLYHLSRISGANDFLYVYGFDLALVALIFQSVSRRKIILVYEVPDIRELFFSAGLGGKILRFIEQAAVPRIDLLVVTSGEFVTEYFMRVRKIRIRDYLVIENKIHAAQMPVAPCTETKASETGRIKIGYFGVLRCQASFRCLIRLADTHQFEVILQGILMPSTAHFEAKIRAQKNMTYLGPYQVPEDLATIYNSVDIIWAAYPFSAERSGNHVWARTNRFYESLYFQKPLIVQEKTADASRARQLGNVAFEIDLKEENLTVLKITSLLNRPYLRSARLSLGALPKASYLITNEYKDLTACLQQNKL